MKILVKIPMIAGEEKVLALIDSGAGGNFIHSRVVNQKKLSTTTLVVPLQAYNVDGTPNSNGIISEVFDTEVDFGDHTEEVRFYVSGLGKQDLILGYPWLKMSSPTIDWSIPSVSWPSLSVNSNEVEISPEIDEVEDFVEEELSVEINSKNSTSQILAWKSEEDVEKKKLPKEQLVPSEYHDFLHLFDKKTSERFPKSTVYDHKIELKEGFIPKTTKLYPLTVKEDEVAKRFVEDNLRKGYIRPSESPMTSGFFFVGKKEAGELRPCQDYKYLNDWTIKNRYPLPLVTDLMDKLKDAKYFTKLDVRAGYNNVRIREGDEWKAAFKTKYGSFEPLVMFFGMTNSPATFQHMMDTIFQPYIDMGWLIDYIDDLLIFARTKEELAERTRLVLKKIEENDLYLKPEKAEFCVQQLVYLGIIIEPRKISMDPAKLDRIRQ